MKKLILLVLSLCAAPLVFGQQGSSGYWNYYLDTNANVIAIDGYTGPGGAVTIPSVINGMPVVTIAEVFAFQSNITSVTIPNGVTDIDGLSFADCTSLTSVNMPDGVTNIGEYAFSGCTQLPNISIPASVISIGWGAFEETSNLTSFNVDPQNPNFSSKDGVLFDKTQSTLIAFPGAITGSYAVPDTVTTIGPVAFELCHVSSVTLDNSLVYIGYNAFAGCPLSNIFIPAGVSGIGDGAFSYVGGLQHCSLLFEGSPPQLGGTNVFFDSILSIVYLQGVPGWLPTFGGGRASHNRRVGLHNQQRHGRD